MKRLIFIIFISAGMLAAYSGRIVDARSGQPISGVNIYNPENRTGTVSDSTGTYWISDMKTGSTLVFTHIGYEQLTLTAVEIMAQKTIRMNPTAVTLESVTVTEKRISWLEAEMVASQRNLDNLDMISYGVESVGQALTSDPAVIITEDVEGAQTISIRGSDAEEVIVAYDGMVLNNDNSGTFDLSMLNIYDISEYQLIKGANTALFGSGAFGGVVNIDPKYASDEHVEMYGRTDSRGSRIFGANAYWKQQRNEMKIGLTDQNVFYTFYSDTSQKNVRFITFLDKFQFSEESRLSLNSFYYTMDTQNLADAEPHTNENLLVNLKYHGALFGSPDFQMEGAYRKYLEYDEYYTRFGTESLNYDNQGVNLTVGKKFMFAANTFQIRLDKMAADFVGRSHWSTSTLQLDYRDNMNKDQNAVTGVWKYKSETGSSGIQWLEMNASLRYDDMRLETDKYFQQDLYPVESDSVLRYSGMTHKVGMSVSSQFEKLGYNVYVLNGNNIRFPTFDELYRRNYTSVVIFQSSELLAESMSSTEIGTMLTLLPKDANTIFEEIRLNAAYYKYYYANKIYEYESAGSLPTPVNSTGNDNKGWELTLQFAGYNDRFTATIGALKLDISDYRVLQNKPASNYFVEWSLKRAAFSIKAHYFWEGTQYYAYRTTTGNWFQGESEGRSNLNLFASGRIHVGPVKMDAGGSYYNVLSDDNDTNYLTQKKWNLQIGIHI